MWFYCIILSSFLVVCHTAPTGTNCLDKEKSLGVLDLAKESINKAKQLFPNCSDDDFSNSTGCGKKEKAIAFLEIAKNLISEAKKTYPTCPYVKRPEVEPPIVEPTTVKPPVTEPPVIIKAKPRDCSDALQLGYNISDVYEVWPKPLNTSILVYCDMDTDGGGWTVIQRRGYHLKTQDFYQSWEIYKRGFGDLRGEFWLGNENIHILSNQGDYEVRFDMKDFEGNKRDVEYKNFRIENETNGYRLQAAGYSGNAGNSLSYENGNVFCTKDRQNGKQYGGVPCTTSRETGWWFLSCNQVNINGVPRKDKSNTGDEKNLYWKTWKDFTSLASADMKLRRKKR